VRDKPASRPAALRLLLRLLLRRTYRSGWRLIDATPVVPTTGAVDGWLVRPPALTCAVLAMLCAGEAQLYLEKKFGLDIDQEFLAWVWEEEGLDPEGSVRGCRRV
jgi:hypothetical protein